jgi:hypothetical protein
MSEASSCIADLDAALAEAGEDIRLVRLTLAAGGEQIPFSADCRGLVRQYQPQELVGGIIQGDTKVILSPTQLAARQWPGPGLAPLPQKGDRVLIQGRQRNVEAVEPFYVADVLVRLELTVRG